MEHEICVMMVRANKEENTIELDMKKDDAGRRNCGSRVLQLSYLGKSYFKKLIHFLSTSLSLVLAVVICCLESNVYLKADFAITVIQFAVVSS